MAGADGGTDYIVSPSARPRYQIRYKIVNSMRDIFSLFSLATDIVYRVSSGYAEMLVVVV